MPGAKATGAARFGAVLALCSVFATPLAAHRLDEYLQTAQVTVEEERVVVDVYLSPGTEVAAAVIAAIDKSGDGTISSDEERDYALSVVNRATLRLDAVSIPLALQSFAYPALADLSAGVGSIRVSAMAAIRDVAQGTHVVSFENGFRPPNSIYMGNAMLPRTSSIDILEQARNPRQDQLDVRFRVNSPLRGFAALAWIASWTVGILAVALLVVRGARRFFNPSRRPSMRQSGSLVVIAAVLVGTAALSAQGGNQAAAPAPAIDRRDISGFWGLGYDGRKVPNASLMPAVTRARLDASAKKDAHNIRWCNLVGMPALMDLGRPLDIRQGPTTIMIVPEVSSVAPRYIYTNRSTHISEDVYDPSTNGDSIGRWEGDVLVVDTVGFHESHGLMAIPGGGFRTPTARLVERYTLVGDGSTLSVTFTWTDPKMFRTPHTYEFRYNRYPSTYEAVTPAGCGPWDPVRSAFFEPPAPAKPTVPATRPAAPAPPTRPVTPPAAR